MKKTLIALLALVGLAASAHAETSLLESSYIGFSDFSTGIADYGQEKDNITVSTTGTITTLTGVTFDTSSNTKNADGFSITLVLDLAKLPAVETCTSIGVATGQRASKSDVTIGVGLNTDRTLKGYYNNGAYTNGPTSSVLPNTGTTIITYTLGAHDSSSGSWIYVEGNDPVYATGLASSNFNYTSIDINNLGGAVQQAYVHNYTLTTAQVATLTGEIKAIAVPEPTSSMLGLVGMVALSFRRRRK